jgi:hypothetical protein
MGKRSGVSRKRLLASIEVFFEQGLLVVADRDSAAAHETFDPTRGPVHHDGDSLHVLVQNAADGPVTVDVFERKAPRSSVADLTLVFDGRLEGSHGALVLEDTSDRVRVAVDTEEDESPRVRVYLDDPAWAEHVVVVLG